MVRVLASSGSRRYHERSSSESAVKRATASGVRTLHLGRALSAQPAHHRELRARMVHALSGE